MVTARAMVLVGVLAVVGALPGCGGQQVQRNAAQASRSSTVPSSAAGTASWTPDPSVQLQTEVIAAYEAMWSDMQVAATTADYGSAALDAHAVDPATGQLRRMLLAFHQMGWVAKGDPMPHPTVVSLSPPVQPTTAQVVDCLDETHWLTYRADSGALTDDRPGQRFRVTAALRQGSDGWKVESFQVAAGGTC